MSSTSRHSKKTGPPNKVHRKVLLVDDNLDLLELVIDFLNFLGHEVIAARDAEEALERLKAIPDLQVLISDVTMPGMSGIELAHRARQMYPGLRVLLVSGRADLVAAQGATQYFDFLPKPYRIADVEAYLAHL
ncbi:response regulator [Noviherbaspirillum humi]|uniref:response regulator n=1 Tax=Noviherbaspirillum humi TaxID=1688639 RepID=UPI000B794DA0|nr:response regulator [Noviherbaspirillum humi]